MTEDLKMNLKILLESDEIEDRRVALNVLLSEEISLEERFNILGEFMGQVKSDELKDDFKAVYDSLYTLIKKLRIKEI